MEAVFTGKEITKNYFFLMIDADDFKILVRQGLSAGSISMCLMFSLRML